MKETRCEMHLTILCDIHQIIEKILNEKICKFYFKEGEKLKKMA